MEVSQVLGASGIGIGAGEIESCWGGNDVIEALMMSSKNNCVNMLSP